MASHTPSDPFEEYSTKRVPPPPTPTAQKSKKKPKLSKKFLWTLGGLAVVGAGVTVTTVAYANNTEKLTEYEAAHDALQEDHETATEVLEAAGSLEPESQEGLSSDLSSLSRVLGADAPGVMSFQIQERTDELLEGSERLDASIAVLEEAIEQRDAYNSTVSDAEGRLEEAQEVLAGAKGEVADDATYDKLADQVAELEDALGTDPDEASGASYSEQVEAIDTEARGIGSNTEAVSASHDDWVEAEERAARQDPANYDTISERDWQLVERNPDAHEGEKYVLYGAVAQADANMGGIAIRVNTSPVQQSRRYNYDINTYVVAGNLDVFSDVVQGDHVKILLEVTGARTYDTTIGGSATAVMGTAYDVEVIGQF